MLKFTLLFNVLKDTSLSLPHCRCSITQSTTLSIVRKKKTNWKSQSFGTVFFKKIFDFFYTIYIQCTRISIIFQTFCFLYFKSIFIKTMTSFLFSDINHKPHSFIYIYMVYYYTGVLYTKFLVYSLHNNVIGTKQTVYEVHRSTKIMTRASSGSRRSCVYPTNYKISFLHWGWKC